MLLSPGVVLYARHPVSRPLAMAASDLKAWRDEAYHFMGERDWGAVEDELRAAVSSTGVLPGDCSASAPLGLEGLPLTVKDSWKQVARQTWALHLAYYGPSFRGYAWQPVDPLDTVAGLLEDRLQTLLRSVDVDAKKPHLASAGRTDAGVSAIGQLVSFFTWATLTEEAIMEAVNGYDDDDRVLSARKVPRSFHATFSARWRRYVYLLPPHDAKDVAVAAVDAQVWGGDSYTVGAGWDGERLYSTGALTSHVSHAPFLSS